MGFLCLVLAVLTVCVPSKAHYKYSPICCGGNDCGEIVSMALLPSGERLITIKLQNGELRTTKFPINLNLQPPIDSKNHACIPYNEWNGFVPGCVYLKFDF